MKLGFADLFIFGVDYRVWLGMSYESRCEVRGWRWGDTYRVHGIPWRTWVRMDYDERHAIDPLGWPLAKEDRVMTTPQGKLEIAQEVEQAVGALRELKDFQVETAEDIDFAGEALLDVKASWDRLEERRKEITAPLNEALRSANDLFRPALSALLDAEVLLKTKIAAAQTAITRRNREAMEAAQKALAAGDARAAAVAAVAIAPVHAPTGVTTREVWEFRVVDAALVPRQYLSVDEKLVRAAVASGVREISGVLITQGTQVIARGR